MRILGSASLSSCLYYFFRLLYVCLAVGWSVAFFFWLMVLLGKVDTFPLGISLPANMLNSEMAGSGTTDFEYGQVSFSENSLQLKIEDRQVQGVALGLLLALTYGIIMGIGKVKRMLANISDAMPFVTDNIRILRWLAYGCFLLAFTETIMMLLLPWLLDDALAAVGVSVSSLLSINFSWLMMGALLLILGEVFERGHQLQQAQ